MNPEIERLLELIAEVPAEMWEAALERECADVAVRDQVTALLRCAEEAEAYIDSIVRDLPPYRPKQRGS